MKRYTFFILEVRNLEHMKSILGRVVAATAVVLLLSTSYASAETSWEKSALAKQQVGSQSEEALSNLSMKVFVDAHTAARIIGYDRNEIDQLKRDIQALRDENARLRNQSPVAPAAAPITSSGLERRVAALEVSFSSLQSTLGSVVTMLTMLLGRLQ